MADSSVAITAGTGTAIDTRTESTNGQHRQVVVIGDPATNAGVAPVDATSGLSVSITNASLTVASHAVTNAGTFAVQAAATNAGTFVVQENGTALTRLTSIAKVVAGEYETVAASQTAQALGATGATGDFISHLLVIPATTSPGNVLLLDNATSITVFAGGASSVSNLVPFVIPLAMISASGAWKVTTGASVSVIGVGDFT